MNKKYCPYCGRFMPENDKWCQKCRDKAALKLIMGFLGHISKQEVAK